MSDFQSEDEGSIPFTCSTNFTPLDRFVGLQEVDCMTAGKTAIYCGVAKW